MSNQNTIDYVSSGQASLGKANHKSLRGAFATPEWLKHNTDARKNLEDFYTGIVFAPNGEPKSPKVAYHPLNPNAVYFKDDSNPDFPDISLDYKYNNPPAHNDIDDNEYAAAGGEPGTPWSPWPVSPGAGSDNPADIPNNPALRDELNGWARHQLGSAPFIGPGTDLSPKDASGKHHRKPNGHIKGRSAPGRPLGWGVNSE